jgi:hypothetical protein
VGDRTLDFGIRRRVRRLALSVAQVAVNLLLAWLVIRLAAEMVPNPVLARLIAVLSACCR